MEDSASTGHHNQRKRSSDNNAFAKFVPFSPPLGHDHESHDHGQKRLKPNSEAPLSETTTTTNNFSSHIPKQNIDTNETPFFSPSTSMKHSTNSGPSPQSIGSMSSHIEYVENDGQVAKIVTDSCYWKEDQNQSELESVMSVAAEELSKRPKTGGIYNAMTSQHECTVKRLKDMSNKEATIDVGLEMSSNEIEMAGQKGHKGAMLLLQAGVLRKKGQELIAECQNLRGYTLTCGIWSFTKVL